MTDMACGLIGLLLGAGIFSLGLFAARDRERLQARGEESPTSRAEPEEAPEEERLRQIEADRRAFSALMGYNADVAYGLERLGEEARR